jgi:hypothetical protein
MTSSSMTAARSQYLPDLFARVPDPRKRRGRRHSLAGLLATGIGAVITIDVLHTQSDTAQVITGRAWTT